MQVGVAYAENHQQVWLRIEVPDGACVMEAIEQSGLLARYPHIDLSTQKVGIFGKVVKTDTPLSAGDRIEIYRPILCDPTQVPRRDTGEEEEK
jgi:uncharacterized protein